MAISYVAAGTWSASSISIAPGMPSGVGAGNIMLLCLLSRSDSTGTAPTISGWTLIDSEVVTVGSEAGDSGSVCSMVYKREWQSGDTAPTVDPGAEGWNAGAGIILAYSKTSGTWVTASATGIDSTVDTSHSAAATSDPGGASGDVLVSVSATNGNFTGLTLSSEAASWSGCTLGTLNQRFNDDSSAGRDMQQVIHDVAVSSGTSSGNPSVTWTWAASTTNSPASAVVYVRLREDTGGGTQDISPSGLATAEAFGSATVSPGAVDIAPTGVAGAEALGSPTLTTTVDVAPTGLASVETFGSATITPGAVDISPTGVSSTEAFGSHTVAVGAQFITPTGIVSEESFDSVDPRYEYGMSTPDLLARSTITTPTGVDDGSDGNGYWEASPAADKTWDMRSATFSGHFDCDATEADTYPTGRYNTPNSPTNHQINSRPIRLGYTTPPSAPAIIGGKVTGDQATYLGWTDLKHGSYIQGLIDDGMDPDLAYGEIIGNANMDGDPRLYFSSGSWAVVDGLRGHNTWDGFGIYGNGTRTATGAIYLRNVWILANRDDGIENDEQRELHMFDCLLEDVHSFLSTRANDTTGTPDSNNTQTIENCVIKLTPGPGGHKLASSERTIGYIFKSQTNSPYLVMRDTVIAFGDYFNYADGPTLPERSGDSYENVTICWLGSGAYPGNVPTGVTVLTGTTAEETIALAISKWKARHGVTDFDTVDMSMMIAPAGLAVVATYSITATGIASEEAFGSHTVSDGSGTPSQSISPTGIPAPSVSTNIFGTSDYFDLDTDPGAGWAANGTGATKSWDPSGFLRLTKGSGYPVLTSQNVYTGDFFCHATTITVEFRARVSYANMQYVTNVYNDGTTQQGTFTPVDTDWHVYTLTLPFDGQIVDGVDIGHNENVAPSGATLDLDYYRIYYDADEFGTPTVTPEQFIAPTGIPMPTVDTNIVADENFDFESGIIGWDTFSDEVLTHDTTTSAVGTGSLKVTKGTATWPTVNSVNAIHGDIPLGPSYTVSFWMKASSAVQGFFQTYTDFESAFETFDVTTEWQQFTFPGQAFSGEFFTRFDIGPNETTPAGFTYWVDDVQIVSNDQAVPAPTVIPEQFLAPVGIPAPGNNEIGDLGANTGFETDITGWGDLNGTLSRDTTTSAVGSASLKLVASTASWWITFEQASDLATVAGPKAVSFWAKASVAQTGANVEIYTDNYNTLTSTTVDLTTEWQKFTIDLGDEPAGFSAFYLYRPSGNADVPTVWIDGLSFGPSGGLGDPTVIPDQSIAPTGIASTEAVGEPTVVRISRITIAQGITTEVAFGTPTLLVTQPIVLTGLDSAEAFGSHQVQRETFLVRTPRVTEAPAAIEYPLRRVGIQRGVTYYKSGGEWYSGRDLPDDPDLNATEIYRGGYEYDVDADKAAELEALGFTVRTEMR